MQTFTGQVIGLVATQSATIITLPGGINATSANGLGTNQRARVTCLWGIDTSRASGETSLVIFLILQIGDAGVGTSMILG